MKNYLKLEFLKELKDNLNQKNPLIQVVMGPRQVGKTTSIQMYLSKLKPTKYHYVSADGDIFKASSWVFEQWTLAKQQHPQGLLVIDEIQKIENWSEIIKKLWDEQKQDAQKLQVILLSSSSLQIQKGLSESLAGRYQAHYVYHWSFFESHKAYNLNFQDYLIYGGYPASYPFIKNKIQWLNYVKHSIVEPVIGKDILSSHKVKSPALFKQCFDLICSYPAQEISYTKLLGQLQKKGNIEIVKYYMELFEKAFLIKQLFKYSAKETLVRSSSPKILPLCPALFSITQDAVLDTQEQGRVLELIVGMALNRLPGKLFYWREKNDEVDYIYKFGKKVHAIEVKSQPQKQSKGLMKFKDKFPHAQTYIVTSKNYEKIIKTFNKKTRLA